MNKKHLNFLGMANLTAGFLGMQFGWALQMTNMSGIYKFLGASASQIGYLWIFAPLTGLLIQPILGQMSDRTWVRWLGRRKPYILLGAIISVVAIILMPHSSTLWMAAALLFLLDSSINMTMGPYRAMIADIAPVEQHTYAYCIQTFMTGIGGTIAAALPWILVHIFHVVEHHTPGMIPLSIRLSFYIGACGFLLANLWSIFVVKEYPPEDFSQWQEEMADKKSGIISQLKDIWFDAFHMPRLMKEISVVQFFTWIGWFCVFLYFSLNIAQNIFGLPAGADVAKNVTYGQMMEKGVVLFGLCYGAHIVVSMIFSLTMTKIANAISRKYTHMLALYIGALAMFASAYTHSEVVLFVAMIGLGICWGSTNTLPYAILAGGIPEEKMGMYMGLFNMTICIPEIIASVFLGYVSLHLFHSNANYIILLGGFAYLLGGLFMFIVKDKVKA